MRKSRVIALVVASLMSSASFAKAQSAAPVAKGARHEKRDGMPGERGDGGALRGLTLSDVEKARLKTIHGRYASEGKPLRESLKPAMQEARAARQKGDTAAARAVWEKNKSGRDQLAALRSREEAEVRGVLSPENQKLFDANIAQRTQRRAEWTRNGGRRGEHKGHRDAANG